MFRVRNTNHVQRFSIRKVRFGAASVLLGVLVFISGPQVSADQLSLSHSVGAVSSASLVSDAVLSTEDSPVSAASVQSELASSSQSPELVNQPTDVDLATLAPELSTEKSPVSATSVQSESASSSQSPEPVNQPTDVDLATLAPELSTEDATISSPLSLSVSLDTTTLDQDASLEVLDSPFRSARHGSGAIGDDYPQVWKNGVVWKSLDKWNMYVKECVSFVAYRLSAVNGFELPAGYGNANTWGHIARRTGYRVDMTPAVGAIAWMDSHQHGAFGAGHVAWVSQVLGDRVELEEYNFNNAHAYHRRVIHRSEVTGYIHFKDLQSGTVPATVSIPHPAKPSLAPRGTYRFDKRSGIKAQAKLSSPDLAYYDVGNTVNYDSLVEADGHQWLSYLSYAGNRRYIAVRELVSQPQLTGRVTVSHTPRGFDVLVSDVPQHADITAVKLGVWTSAKGQDDLVWYTATKQLDGKYKTTVSLEQHDKATGDYEIQLQYITSSRDKVTISTTKTRVAERPATSPQLAPVNLPSRGTYHFKQRASIKAEPRQSSPELAYYDLGYSVNYDSIITAEGKHWLSYLSYSGNRRYIALP